MTGRRSPKGRHQQVRLAARRERKRLARRGRRYFAFDMSEPAVKHRPVPNPAYKAPKRRKLRGAIMLSVPESLACETASDWSILAKLLKEIRSHALRGNHRKVVLDFSESEVLAPEAAVALVAEIQRCRAFCDRRVVITGTYPHKQGIAALLCDMGFFSALGVAEPSRPSSYTPRTYVKVSRKNANLPEFADELLLCFEEVFDFDPRDRKRLYMALLESMDNVFEHAYPPGSQAPHFLREWWLCGYADKDQETISFTFYDQGAGIPSTIRERQALRIRNILTWTDGRWIQRAVEKGVSRHKSKRRGHGLQRLREFIEELDVQGSLTVAANRGITTFSPDGNVDVGALSEELNGTIVVWQLRGIRVTVPARSSGEGSDGV